MARPSKTDHLEPPAEREAEAAASLLETVRRELRQRGLEDVMTDGSQKALAAANVVDAVIRGLREDKNDVLLRLERVVVPRRERAADVDSMMEILNTAMTSDPVNALVSERKYDEAGEQLARHLLNAVIGIADLLRELRRHLMHVDKLEAAESDLALELSQLLEEDDRDELWRERVMRAAFRAWTGSPAAAEGMLDFIRKRAKKSAGAGPE